MTRLVLDVLPSQLMLSKDGKLKVAFFDKEHKINVTCDDKGRELTFDKTVKLFIHIEIPSDSTTVVEREVQERKVLANGERIWVSETILFERAHKKYLERKNEVVYNPQDEIEELKKKLAAAEAPKTRAKSKPKLKAEDVSLLENASEEKETEE